MTNENFFLCLPYNFNNICYIYSPTVKEVIATKNFNFYLKLLTISQEEIEDEFVKEQKTGEILTPLENLLNLSYNNKEIEEGAKEAFYFFIHEPITFLYDKKTIIIGDLKEALSNTKKISNLRTITEETFFDFQNLIRKTVGEKVVEKPDPNEHPKIRAMKAKARYRDKIKAKQNSKNGLSLLSSLASICCMGFGLNPLNIGEISYVSVSILMSMYQDKEKYETDVKSLLAGADKKKVKPKYWIKNIEN